MFQSRVWDFEVFDALGFPATKEKVTSFSPVFGILRFSTNTVGMVVLAIIPCFSPVFGILRFSTLLRLLLLLLPKSFSPVFGILRFSTQTTSLTNPVLDSFSPVFGILRFSTLSLETIITRALGKEKCRTSKF